MAAAITAAVMAATSTLGDIEQPCLVVSKPGAGELERIALPDGRFDHVFVHSFHLTPVRERFRVEPDGRGGALLRLYELRYRSPGVGMPDDAELGYRLESGEFVLAMDRSYESIPLAVSVVVGHGVEIDGTLYPFSRWAAPEEGLILSAKIGTVQPE